MHFYKFFALFSWTDILPKKILAQDYLNSLEQMQEEEGADYWNRRMVHISHLDRCYRIYSSNLSPKAKWPSVKDTWTLEFIFRAFVKS